MKDTSFWRSMAVLFVGGLFYVGRGLHSGQGIQFPSLTPSVHAGVGVADENSETLFTASEDGKEIYMWQYFEAAKVSR